MSLKNTLTVLIATSNKNKVKELLSILPSKTKKGQNIIYKTLSDFNVPEIAETGKTLQENALIKARVGLEYTGLITLADDSGLLVDALPNDLGVKSARYAFPDKCDHTANNQKLLTALKDISKEKRNSFKFLFSNNAQDCWTAQVPA